MRLQGCETTPLATSRTHPSAPRRALRIEGRCRAQEIRVGGRTRRESVGSGDSTTQVGNGGGNRSPTVQRSLDEQFTDLIYRKRVKSQRLGRWFAPLKPVSKAQFFWHPCCSSLPDSSHWAPFRRLWPLLRLKRLFVDIKHRLQLRGPLHRDQFGTLTVLRSQMVRFASCHLKVMSYQTPGLPNRRIPDVFRTVPIDNLAVFRQIPGDFSARSEPSSSRTHQEVHDGPWNCWIMHHRLWAQLLQELLEGNV